MENKERVVIKYDGMKFMFAIGAQEIDCNECQAINWCYVGSPVGILCCGKYHCVSATKIEDEGKVYNAWDGDKVSHLIHSEVLYYFVDPGFGARWRKAVLIKFNEVLRTFVVRVNGEYENVYSIREIKPETITLTEARERFNIPANVIIAGE